MTTSLTPLIVTFIVKDISGNIILDTSDTSFGVLLNSVSYSLSVNQIAEGTVSLGYTNQNGFNNIKKLFPSGTNAAYFSKGIISIKGFNTRYSLIPKDFIAFEGTILGYGQESTISSVNITVNMRGNLFEFQHIPMFAPGFHASNNLTLTVNPLVNSNQTQGNFANSLINASLDARSGIKLFKNIVNSYRSIGQQLSIQSTNPAIQDTSIFTDLITILGLNNVEYITKLANQLNNIVELGNLDLDIIELIAQSEISRFNINTIANFSVNAQQTFWDLLLTILEQYGLSIISIGSKILAVPKLFLTKGIANNKITKSDILSYNISDFPFLVPTRCFVTVKNRVTNFVDKSTIGAYPDTNKLTEEEKRTGVFTIMAEEPGLLANINLKQEATRQLQVTNSFNFEASGNLIEDTISNINSIIELDNQNRKPFYNLYAQYILMLEKLKQKNGSLVTRFRPDIIPGFCAEIEDPLDIQNVTAYISNVSHSIDCQNASTGTTIGLGFIRYGNEIDFNFNPLYPNYDTDLAGSQAKSIMGVLP